MFPGLLSGYFRIQRPNTPKYTSTTQIADIVIIHDCLLSNNTIYIILKTIKKNRPQRFFSVFKALIYISYNQKKPSPVIQGHDLSYSFTIFSSSYNMGLK